MNLAIIQARLGSTRLPNKVLLKLGDKTIIEHVVERVKNSKLIDDVLVATTISKNDLEIVSFCAQRGIRIFIGSEEDVLDRYYQAAKLIAPTNVIRITSDCPMIDPEIIDKIIQTHVDKSADYTSNTLEETFPDGLDAEVFSLAALKTAWQDSTLRSDREHVTPFIKNNPTRFKLVSVTNDRNLSHLRWTIDQIEDYEFLQEIFSKLYSRNPFFKTLDILSEIEKNPKLAQINGGIIRNEGYLKSLDRDKLKN